MEKDRPVKITIWNEGRHEQLHPKVAQIYPNGIHAAIADGLKNEEFTIRCGTLDDPDEGLSEEILNDTDVVDPPRRTKTANWPRPGGLP